MLQQKSNEEGPWEKVLRRRFTGEGPMEKVHGRRFTGEGPMEKVRRRRSVGEGPLKRVHRRRSVGEGTTEKIHWRRSDGEDDRYPSPMEELNPKDWPIRWENPSSLSTTPHSCVESMWDRIIPYPLRNRMSTDGIHFGWLTLWLAFTPSPPLVHRVTLF